MSLPVNAGRHRQHGGFLLEALVGILIFTLGVLGLLALQGRAIAYSSDAQYRGEAAYLANAYLAKMWADRPTELPTRYVRRGRPNTTPSSRRCTGCPAPTPFANNPTVTLVQPPPEARSPTPVAASRSTRRARWSRSSSSGASRRPRVARRRVHNYTMTSILGLN